MWILFLTGIFLIGMGLYQLLADKDHLWERQERGFRAQGIVNRQRTPEWERSQTLSGSWILALGIATVVGGLMIVTMFPKQRNSSTSGERFYIDGREISRAEADRMGISHLFK